MKRDRETIFKKIFIPLLFVMLLQIALFFLIIYRGGVLNRLKANAYDIIQERVINRKNELETKFTLNWMNLDSAVTNLNEIYRNECKTNGGSERMDLPENQKLLLQKSAESLIRALRQNEVNGVFLILNGQTEADGKTDAGAERRYGLCIRDLDVNSDYMDREDLMLDRGPASMIPDLGIKLDSWWESYYTFDDRNHGDFYFKPLQAAMENPGADYDDLAYISAPHKVSEIDTEMISYSVPLLADDGTPYGVLGIEISTNYLAGLMPSSELSGAGEGSYCLARNMAGSDEFEPWVTEGAFFSRNFEPGKNLILKKQVTKNCYEMTSAKHTGVTLAVSPLEIYNKNTPFESEQIVLLGIEQTDELMDFSSGILRAVTLAGALSLLLSLLGILVISRSLSLPIRALATQVRDLTPEADLRLKRLGISEIDQLEESIETLSHNVSESQAKTEFFSRMSHDMRTPMNAVIGFSSPELIGAADEATLKDYMEKIHSSGNYLLGLINEVLDMTKIQSGRMTFHEEVMNPREFWTNTLPIIEEIAEQKQVNFVKDFVPQKQPIYVMGDQQRMQQIFVNLLSNAVKFTPKGGTVTLSTVLKHATDHRIAYEYRVKDTGIGMSEEFQKRLFTPFEQENPGREGTGLGLSITKELIEHMGGSIRFTSEKGKGTEFVVCLEFERADGGSLKNGQFTAGGEAGPAEGRPDRKTSDGKTSDGKTSDSKTPDGKTSDGKASDGKASGGKTPDDKTEAGQTGDYRQQLSGKRILICEDHPLNRQIATALLKKQGILVESAENGKLGVDQFAASESGYYDAILMDVRMPVMNGLEATKAIRALDRLDAATVPILAMTANAFKEDVDASREAGMNEHLSKPIEPQLLYRTLVQYLGDGK